MSPGFMFISLKETSNNTCSISRHPLFHPTCGLNKDLCVYSCIKGVICEAYYFLQIQVKASCWTSLWWMWSALARTISGIWYASRGLLEREPRLCNSRLEIIHSNPHLELVSFSVMCFGSMMNRSFPPFTIRTGCLICGRTRSEGKRPPRSL